MSESSSPTATAETGGTNSTTWQRLASAEPIRIRDPLAEVLGMVEEGDPLHVSFEEVATAAGHACPAVAGAYRSTQLALEELYPETLPVRSEIAVTVGGTPETHGLGPMANVIRQITGAADETGFTGFGGYGGRDDLLAFGEVDAPDRAFRFERTDTNDAVTVGFDPASAGVDPEEGGGPPMQTLTRIVAGEADDEEAERFHEEWHERVQRILEAPAEGGPFTVRVEN
jgi:hypothetical protein